MSEEALKTALTYWNAAQPFINQAATFLGGAATALSLYFAWRALKSAEEKGDPVFEVEVKKTTSAEYVLELNVRNKSDAKISIRKVELIKPKNIDIAVFHIWHGRMPPELTASSLPVDVEIPIEPTKEGGISFFVMTKAKEGVRLKVFWTSHKEKPKAHTKVIEFPLSLFKLVDVQLEDYNRSL